MRNAIDHYVRLYGDLNLRPDDVARCIFASGWNAALDEFQQRLKLIPMGDDVHAVFALYVRQMMCCSPDEPAHSVQ